MTDDPSYTWLVERMDTYANKDGYHNFVYNIWWRVNGEYQGAKATIAGQQPVGADTGPSNWTPYEQITEQEAIQWVQTAMNPLGVSNVKNTLLGMMLNQISPPTSANPLPWG